MVHVALGRLWRRFDSSHSDHINNRDKIQQVMDFIDNLNI